MASKIIDTFNIGGGKKMAYGTWTTANTAATITTGLTVVEGMTLCPNSAAVVADQCVVNATFPVVDSITIAVINGVGGYWSAIGI